MPCLLRIQMKEIMGVLDSSVRCGIMKKLYKKKCDEEQRCICGYHLKNKKALPETTVKTMVNLAKILQGIHSRLIMEGWKIEPGKFTKPDGTIIYAKKTHE